MSGCRPAGRRRPRELPRDSMRVGETVQRAAVHDQLPVRAGPVHSLGERRDIAERHVRVQSAMADEQPGADRAGFRSPAGGEAPVDADPTCDGFTRSREREDGQPAEAEADSRDAPVCAGQRARAARPACARRIMSGGSSRSVVRQRMTRSLLPAMPSRTCHRRGRYIHAA